MQLLGWLKETFEKFAVRSEDTRPIGLRQFSECTGFSNDELLNQLAQPIKSTPKFSAAINQRPMETPLKYDASAYRKVVTKAAPSFAYAPPVDFSVPNLQKRTQYSGFGRLY